MNILCKWFGHKATQYGSQGKIDSPYHDGIGRAHRVVHAKCERCEKMFKVGAVIDRLQQQETQG